MERTALQEPRHIELAPPRTQLVALALARLEPVERALVALAHAAQAFTGRASAEQGIAASVLVALVPAGPSVEEQLAWAAVRPAFAEGKQRALVEESS